MAINHKGWKHTNGGMPSREPCWAECTTTGEQLDDDLGLIVQKWKDNTDYGFTCKSQEVKTWCTSMALECCWQGQPQMSQVSALGAEMTAEFLD